MCARPQRHSDSKLYLHCMVFPLCLARELCMTGAHTHHRHPHSSSVCPQCLSMEFWHPVFLLAQLLPCVITAFTHFLDDLLSWTISPVLAGMRSFHKFPAHSRLLSQRLQLPVTTLLQPSSLPWSQKCQYLSCHRDAWNKGYLSLPAVHPSGASY